MKLQISTDYAIRIIVYLAQCEPKLCSAAEASKQLGLSYNFFGKVALPLKKAGLIASVQGINGGYRLAKKAEDITLYDVIKTMQGEILVNNCLEEGSSCSNKLVADRNNCSVHNIFASLQTQIISTLNNYSIQDVCDMDEEKRT